MRQRTGVRTGLVVLALFAAGCKPPATPISMVKDGVGDMMWSAGRSPGDIMGFTNEELGLGPNDDACNTVESGVQFCQSDLDDNAPRNGANLTRPNRPLAGGFAGPGGAVLSELALQAATRAAIDGAMSSVTSQMWDLIRRNCMPAPDADEQILSAPTRCIFNGGATVTQTVGAGLEGKAFGSGYKVEFKMDLDSAFDVRVTMDAAHTTAFLANLRANDTNPTVPAGTRIQLVNGKSVKSTVGLQLKVGAEVFGAGSSINVSTGGAVTVRASAGPERSTRRDAPINDLLAEVRADAERIVADEESVEIYERLIVGSADAVMGYVNGRADSSACGFYDNTYRDGRSFTWKRSGQSYRNETGPNVGRPGTPVPGGPCPERKLCCAYRGVLSAGIQSNSAQCYDDTPAYRAQDDCKIFGEPTR